MKKGKKKFIFTITTGRSGTLYLMELLKQNLASVEAHHEILWGFDKFGVDTPDVSHFHEFNSKGNTKKIKNFWTKKLENIGKTEKDYYIETSHLLAKAGLVENLEILKEFGQVYLICLSRDIFKTLVSMQKRNTYLNVGNMWLWHLDPDYPRNIVNTDAYKRFELHGLRLWYIHEMYARSEYYKEILKDVDGVSIIDVDIDDLNEKKGVENLLKEIGFKTKGEIQIPSPQHVGPKNISLDLKLTNHLKKMMKSLIFDADKLAKGYIGAGRRIG